MRPPLSNQALTCTIRSLRASQFINSLSTGAPSISPLLCTGGFPRPRAYALGVSPPEALRLKAQGRTGAHRGAPGRMVKRSKVAKGERVGVARVRLWATAPRPFKPMPQAQALRQHSIVGTHIAIAHIMPV